MLINNNLKFKVSINLIQLNKFSNKMDLRKKSLLIS